MGIEDTLYKKKYYMCIPYSRNPSMSLLESIDKMNKLLDEGYIVFNPITHSHFVDAYKKRTSTFWYEFDLHLLELFDGIIICGDNWQESKGVMLEYNKAKKLKLEILFYEEIINGKD